MPGVLLITVISASLLLKIDEYLDIADSGLYFLICNIYSKYFGKFVRVDRKCVLHIIKQPALTTENVL